MAAFSAACQLRGWNCVRVALAPRWLPILMHNRRHLDHVARRLTPAGRLRGPVVVVGHSAGAAAGSWLTPTLRNLGVHVAGLVLVDGNDSPNHLIERTWNDLASVPIRAVMAPPNPCNRQGRLTSFLEERRPGIVQVIPGAGHGDVEMSGAPVYRRFCSDKSGPSEWKAVQAAVLACIQELLDIT